MALHHEFVVENMKSMKDWMKKYAKNATAAALDRKSVTGGTFGSRRSVGDGRADVIEMPTGGTATRSSADWQSHLDKLPFVLPLRSKEDLIAAGSHLGAEPAPKPVRPGQPAPPPPPLTTAVFNYLLQVFEVCKVVTYCHRTNLASDEPTK
jgi:hypothetical protein